MILYETLDRFVYLLLEATEEEEDGGGFAGNGLFLLLRDNIGDATAQTVLDTGSQVEVIEGFE